MKRVVVLGATGSVGQQTLDIVRAHPELLKVVGLSAGSNDALLAQQLEEFQPEAFAMANRQAGEALLKAHPAWKARCIGLGDVALSELARMPADIVVNALLGYAGLRPTLEALGSGTDVALSNKESMVVAGELVRRTADASGAHVYPVDSEHSAIDQCLRAGRSSEVRRLILTASGGPFRTRTAAEMQQVTLADALQHPTWSMGRKITIDSATLMNKGLEILEARWLFDIEIERVDVVVHPQSIVHSMVEFQDGSVIAQLGTTDMRLPIWYALHAPDRPEAGFGRLDLTEVAQLTFEPLDRERFPCVGLAIEAGRRGGVLPAILNAANEVAVAAYLEERIHYLDIAPLLDTTLREVGGRNATRGAPQPDPTTVTGTATARAAAAPTADAATPGLDLEQIAAADRRARETTSKLIAQRCAAGEQTR